MFDLTRHIPAPSSFVKVTGSGYDDPCLSRGQKAASRHWLLMVAFRSQMSTQGTKGRMPIWLVQQLSKTTE